MLKSSTWHALSFDGPQAEKEIAERNLKQQELEKWIKALSEDDKAKITEFEKEARRLVRGRVALIQETDRKTAMVESLTAALGKTGVDARATTNGELLVCYDQKSAGEPITNPHVRYPPLRTERLRRAVNLTLESLAVDYMPANVTMAIFDAGALGNKGAILNCFQLGETKLPTSQRQVFVAWSEEEMQSRLAKFRAQKQLQQLESIHVVSGPGAQQPRRNRLHWQGCTTAGNVLSNAPLCNLNSGWCLTFKQKKDLYDTMRMPVGGASDGGQVPERNENAVEPTSWHMTSKPVWTELLRSETSATAVLDWCPMDVLPWTCIELGIPYVGICFSKTHVELLYERLGQLMFQKMREEGKFYRADLANLLKQLSVDKAPPKPKPGPKPTPKPKEEPKKRRRRRSVDWMARRAAHQRRRRLRQAPQRRP